MAALMPNCLPFDQGSSRNGETVKLLSVKRRQAEGRDPLSLSESFRLIIPGSSSLSPHGFHCLSLEDHFFVFLANRMPA
jgi:hypothetical protein